MSPVKGLECTDLRFFNQERLNNFYFIEKMPEGFPLESLRHWCNHIVSVLFMG